MHILHIGSAIKEMTIKELRDFIFRNYYRRIPQENSYYSIKYQQKKDLLLLATKLKEKNT